MTMDEPNTMREPHVALDEYVAGVLSPDEQRAVEEHIYECDECRAELDATRRLHVQVRSAFDAEPGPSDRVRREVFAQIAATPRSSASTVPAEPPRTAPRDSSSRTVPRDPQPRTAAPSGGEPSNVVRPRFWSRAPSLPRWAQLAAMVLIVVQAALLIRPLTAPAVPPEQVTPRGLTQAPTQLRVVFNPNATDAQIRELLGALGARIVDGPSATGAYRVELQATDPTAVATALAAARARQDVLQSVDAAP
jgi:hypothetical protein